MAGFNTGRRAAECVHTFESEVSGYKMRYRHRPGDSRDAVLVQCVQGSVAVLSGGSLIHVPEALHGGDVPLDALLREVQLGHKRQRSAVVAAEQHGATVVALGVQTRAHGLLRVPPSVEYARRGDRAMLTAATRLFSETKMTLRSGRNSVFSCEGLKRKTMIILE